MVIPKWYVFINLMNTCPERQQTVLLPTCIGALVPIKEATSPLFLLIKPYHVVISFNHSIIVHSSRSNTSSYIYESRNYYKNKVLSRIIVDEVKMKHTLKIVHTGHASKTAHNFVYYLRSTLHIFLFQPNETWQIGCQVCECDGESMSIQCKPVVCPTTTMPVCDQPGEVLINKTDGCCGSYECRE